VLESRSLRQSYRYVLTPEGHKALDEIETCHCRPRLAGLLVVCPECDTVFGYLTELNAPDGRFDKKG
jgi:hypothetical protein